MTYQLLTKPNDEDILRILAVYQQPSVSRFISIDEQNYWEYVTSTECVYFYKVYADDQLSAVMHLELANGILYMDIVVFPDYQRRGIASKILRDILCGALVQDFHKIHVSIDEKNIASLRLFRNAGFVYVGKDEELLEYEYSVCEKSEY